jgi:esterase/lipase
MKVAFIIPGYGESHTRQKGYREVANYFADQNILPLHIDIDWEIKKKKNFKRFVAQFIKHYTQQILPPKTEVYVLGFSFGATIAFMSASKIKPKALILCSLSPYFKEDLGNFRKSWLTWWKKEFKNSEYSFNKLARKVTSKIYFIVGGEEYKECKIRAEEGHRLIKNSSLIYAKGAKHTISQPEYLTVLQKLIQKL